jgi:dynein light chain LC8-type
MSERKAVIKNADMSEDMQQDAVDCASQALEKYNIEKVCQSYINSDHPYYLRGFPDHVIFPLGNT